MIKYKCLCSYNLSMATKDLTRDEAREAIKILTLRKDSLDNIMVATLGFFILLFIYVYTSDLASGYPAETLALLVLIGVFSVYTLVRFKKLDGEANELAKEHNLKEFLDAISGKK